MNHGLQQIFKRFHKVQAMRYSVTSQPATMPLATAGFVRLHEQARTSQGCQEVRKTI